MIKRVIIGIIAIVVGIGIALFVDSFFREQIQNIFLWSTSNRIQFVGKNFHLFSGYFYYVSFGIAFLIFSLSKQKQKFKEITKSGLLSISLFVVAVIGISAVDANLKVVECTACDNGIRNLHWNEIKYGRILGISILISIIPNVIWIIGNRKKPAHNKELS